MLYITRDSHITGHRIDEYHIGEMVGCGDNVTSIQADGDELEHIIKTFENVPIRKNGRVVNYFGDMAKFIVENW